MWWRLSPTQAVKWPDGYNIMKNPINSLLTAIARIPIYVYVVVIALAMYVIFNALHSYMQQNEAQKVTASISDQQRKWCRDFAMRDDCTAAAYNNVQCPYKKLKNTFKVINIDQCKDFPEEYAALKKLIEHAKMTGKITVEEDPLERLRERVGAKPIVAPVDIRTE